MSDNPLNNMNMDSPQLKNLVEQAKNMQKEMEEAQRLLTELEVIGQAPVGSDRPLVKICMRGNHYCTKVQISPSLFDEDEEVAEDLVMAAINNAIDQINDRTKEQMTDIAKKFKIPQGMEDVVNQDQKDDDDTSGN